ncbi:DUF6538 domain-containing protein [Rhizobium leguminosarum]|uniref:DUF6538 domain-containing protein n=1 Tax=Rhizobium leguminosarum TaxID=384 RepID=UPI001AE27DEA|nr:DUF6538 domain-containing protein [Rhizobium leguminosarum]MBP2445082.1 hypothetical protein [Rhizobium leguminosarum]
MDHILGGKWTTREDAGIDSGNDRYLTRRNGVYCYKRRVPTLLSDLDDRAPIIRTSLKTCDLAKARVLRDGYERADDDFWGALLTSDSAEAARQRYQLAVRRVAALGFTYQTTMESCMARPAPSLLTACVP